MDCPLFLNEASFTIHPPQPCQPTNQPTPTMQPTNQPTNTHTNNINQLPADISNCLASRGPLSRSSPHCLNPNHVRSRRFRQTIKYKNRCAARKTHTPFHGNMHHTRARARTNDTRTQTTRSVCVPFAKCLCPPFARQGNNHRARESVRLARYWTRSRAFHSRRDRAHGFAHALRGAGVALMVVMGRDAAKPISLAVSKFKLDARCRTQTAPRRHAGTTAQATRTYVQ